MESFHSASDLIKIRRGGGGNGTPFQIMLPVSIYTGREIYIHAQAKQLAHRSGISKAPC